MVAEIFTSKYRLQMLIESQSELPSLKNALSQAEQTIQGLRSSRSRGIATREEALEQITKSYADLYHNPHTGLKPGLWDYLALPFLFFKTLIGEQIPEKTSYVIRLPDSVPGFSDYIKHLEAFRKTKNDLEKKLREEEKDVAKATDKLHHKLVHLKQGDLMHLGAFYCETAQAETAREAAPIFALLSEKNLIPPKFIIQNIDRLFPIGYQIMAKVLHNESLYPTNFSTTMLSEHAGHFLKDHQEVFPRSYALFSDSLVGKK